MRKDSILRTLAIIHLERTNMSRMTAIIKNHSVGLPLMSLLGDLEGVIPLCINIAPVVPQ